MESPANTQLARHIYSVQRHVSLTSPRYEKLTKPGLATHPICCFGNPSTARIVTVGLNPSDGEFAEGRNWPNTIEHTALAERCCDYFKAAHRWFDPWHEGLSYLNASYQDGSAVHLDLSPRATMPVSEFKTADTKSLFLEMVKGDLWAFFGTLELCRDAKLIMIAGSVTGKYYINEFLQRHAPAHGYQFVGVFDRRKHPGKGKTCWHKLENSSRTLPVFFCSSSPSDRDKTLLPLRIKENVRHLV